MATYRENIEKMQGQLKIWGAQIRFLEVLTENASAATKLRRLKELNKLRKKHRLATEVLEVLKSISKEAWAVARGTADEIHTATGDDSTRKVTDPVSNAKN